MKINYFIAFETTHFGVGSAHIIEDKPITNFKDIQRIQDLLKKKNKIKEDLIITSWKRFEDE